jgi:hypothetical protein
MIFPPAEAPIPPEATLLYPRGITFLGEGLAFKGMSIEASRERGCRGPAAPATGSAVSRVLRPLLLFICPTALTTEKNVIESASAAGAHNSLVILTPLSFSIPSVAAALWC